MHNAIICNDTDNNINALRNSRKSRRFPTRIVTKTDFRKPVVTEKDLRNLLISFGGSRGGLTLSIERENPIRFSLTRVPKPNGGMRNAGQATRRFPRASRFVRI